MNRLYKHGVVQSVIERVLALALEFDDDGEVDVEDIASVDDTSLYGELLNEFPEWLEKAESCGLA